MNNVLTYYENPSDKEGSCNTPQNIQSKYTVKFDWLTLIADIKSPVGLNQLKNDVEDIFTDKFAMDYGAVKTRGRKWTGGYAKSAYGMELTWDSRLDSPHPKLRLSIPGRVCSRADLLDFAKFLNGLKEYESLGNISCTRLDAAFDDFTKELFSQEDLYEAWESNAIVRLQNKTHDMHVSGCASDEYGVGWTHQWGRGRKSITFYNKAAESEGKVDSHRIEVRYREKDADKAFQELLEYPMDPFEEFGMGFLSGVIAGVVDFRRFPKGRNHGIRDGVRLDWWERVLNVQGGNILRYSAIPPKPNLVRKVEWIKRQVVTSLAQISDVVGVGRYEEWLEAAVKEARERYKEVHRAFIETTKLERKRGLYSEVSVEV